MSKKKLLLYGDSRFNENKNKVILEVTLSYIKNSEREFGSLFECFRIMSTFEPITRGLIYYNFRFNNC